MTLVANSMFAQCSHEIRPKSGWIGSFRGRIARSCPHGRRSGEFATSITNSVWPIATPPDRDYPLRIDKLQIIAHHRQIETPPQLKRQRHVSLFVVVQPVPTAITDLRSDRAICFYCNGLWLSTRQI